ncbi:MAG TPA: class I SAM-dependent methyltransferase, partial [Tepidisphaeraceae bacterium]|nr:class I SAM-dependent methyltransferase [Tepidisphaeraceae bacterium]
DVACGTGQSSRALLEIAERVDAIDISPEMLAEAPADDRIHYQVAPAERLPFADATFDLITVGLAFHWFDQSAFLREAHRVLKSQAWLVVYNDGFNGEMVENAAFRAWAWEVHPKRFPTPPRRSVAASEEFVAPFGFSLRATERFAHEETMSADQLTGYLLTQTNVIAAVESGSTPLDEAAAWIRAGVEPFFRGGTGTMKFSGSISFVQRD